MKKPRRDELKNSKLGSGRTEYHFSYAPEVLEKISNRSAKKIAWTSLICNEFTSLCPKTGQPDFAKIYINYIADKHLVESKSLKLYLFSFRNHGDFHEDCVQKICDDLTALLNPLYIEVIGEFTPRGGISIFPFCQSSQKTWNDFTRDRLAGYAPGRYSQGSPEKTLATDSFAADTRKKFLGGFHG